MKTITFDEEIYRLVLVELLNQFPEQNTINPASDAVDALNGWGVEVCTSPDTLPGVVEHSGEPCGYVDAMTLSRISNELNGNKEIQCSMRRAELVLDSDVALFTHPPAPPDTAALPDQDGFEAWSKREGRCNLMPAINGMCEDGRFYATYHYSPTETAWRAWANKPANNTEALQARIAELTHERDLLGTAIADAAIKAGITNADAPMTGPILLMLANDLAESAQLAAQAGQEPVAWVRRHPDGALTAEFLEDAVIEPVRKRSGAWVPLYLSPPAPANSLAIVQAALEAAADTVPEGDMDELSPCQIKTNICAINPQTIIDVARGK